MKVILLRDVPKVGRKYEVKDVSDGYARNMLFPRKWAEPATAERVKSYEKKVALDREKREGERESLKASIASLSEETIETTAKADERGHLFKKLRAIDVVRLIKESKSIEIPEECITLDAPIAEAGEHAIPLEYEGAKSAVTLIITKA